MSGGRWPWPPERLAEASAAADELRDMVTAGAETTAQLRARIAELEMFARQWAVADAALVRADCRIAELEAAIDKLAQCKGRFHTEANYKALIEVRNKTLHK